MRRVASIAKPTAVVIALLALTWIVVYVGGGTSHVPPHLVYVPVLLAGWRFGYAGALVTALAGGILVGPLLPAEVSTGREQPLTDWALRALFFAGIGTFMAAALARWRSAAAHEMHLARREQELALLQSVFLQTASHEFRTPLTVLMGASRTLQQRGFVTDEGRELLDSLTRAVDRLDELCTIALASAGVLDEIVASASEVVDLRALFLDLADEFDSRGRVVLHTHSRYVRTQPRLLRPALSALLDNALRFSPSNEPVEIIASAVGTRVRIEIVDVGPGFDPGFFERAFNPFTQEDMSLRRVHGGLGIGLFAARRLVEQIGGAVSIERSDRRGAKVVVTLGEGTRVAEEPRREVRS